MRQSRSTHKVSPVQSEASGLNEHSHPRIYYPYCLGLPFDCYIPTTIVAIGPNQNEPKPMELQLLPSQPIPIKSHCTREPEENDDLLDDSSLHYDQATWRMYNRITIARRIRAISRGFSYRQDKTIIISDSDYRPPAHGHTNVYHQEAVKQLHVHHNENLQLSTADRDTNYGVFVLDM